MSDPVHVARTHIANAVRLNRPETEHAARRELTAANLERAIRIALDAEHPLTATEHKRLSTLLAEGGELR